ncbi:MAG TPA: hypothetical protein VGL53_08195 [Bryobacteraceae bacterium]|jgi:hypothetical protein
MNFDEMNFEQELKNALTRKEPAKWFAERVIRQVEPLGQRPRPSARLRQWASLAVAASLMCGVFGVVRYEEYRKGQQAKQQLMLALRITARTLDNVGKKLKE